MEIQISHYSAIGRRENNEDSLTLLQDRDSLLAVVADGLGGLSRGEVASGLATQTMNRLLQHVLPDEDTLIDAIQEASRIILEARKPGERMCTTVASLWIHKNIAYAANVGDSRIYQFRRDGIVFQSMDHSVAQMAVLVGELEQAQLRESPDRNRLTRALGSEDAPKVACSQLNVQPGDRFLLCSDGFWEPVLEDDMLRTLARTTDTAAWLQAMRTIVEAANDPRQDNHTAIAISVIGIQ